VGVALDGSSTGTNGFSGVNLAATSSLVGGTTEAARNVLSLNGTACACFDYAGVVVNGTGNRVMGNFIGTDATGTLDRGNTGNGISVLFGSTSIEKNLISGTPATDSICGAAGTTPRKTLSGRTRAALRQSPTTWRACLLPMAITATSTRTLSRATVRPG
jgi:hypothetical protein